MEHLSPNNDLANDHEHNEDHSGMSRRKMIASTVTGLAGAFVLGNSNLFAQTNNPSTKRSTNSFNLAGKAAMVTGAARGIGRAIALALAEAGADIMAVDICAPVSSGVIYPSATKDDLDETGRQVKAIGRRFIGVVADIRDSAAMKDAAGRMERELGKVDILVADAGIQVYASVAEMTDQQWKDVIDVNLTGTANTVRAVVPHMIPRKYGRIILVASGQGRHGMADGSAYSASKWGMIGLMKSAALELGKYEITVNTLEPGLVDTHMTRNPGRWKEALKEAGKEPKDNPTEEEVIAARLPTAVMKIPWMQPADVAPVAVFLASDAAYRITGATYDATAGDSAKYTA